MSRFISVLEAHEAELISALNAAGVAAGAVIGPAALAKIIEHLKSNGISYQTHNSKSEVSAGRVHNT